MSREPNPELAWAAQIAGQQYRVPTTEPHYTKKDDNLMKYLFERCIVFEWKKNDKGELEREAVAVQYQDILDAVYLRLSHLESVSYLTSLDAEYTFARWRLHYYIMYSKYESLGDEDALHLLRELNMTVLNIIKGRAHEGTHQKYDAAVACSRTTAEIIDNTRKGGFWNRGNNQR